MFFFAFQLIYTVKIFRKRQVLIHDARKCTSGFFTSIKTKIIYTCIGLRLNSRILIKVALTMGYLQMY
jgi:hypothetical protein